MQHPKYGCTRRELLHEEYVEGSKGGGMGQPPHGFRVCPPLPAFLPLTISIKPVHFQEHCDAHQRENSTLMKRDERMRRFLRLVWVFALSIVLQLSLLT